MAATDSPDSTAEQTLTPNAVNSETPKASKDRQCPFCHIPFTSSSLGRHLDLYIKEKNPKPPDGVHHVDKIRQMRGKITRRHPKGSLSAARQNGEQDLGQGYGQGQREAPGGESRELGLDGPFSDALYSPNLANTAGNQRHIPLNRMHWQATGVINDLPGASRNLPSANASAQSDIPQAARAGGLPELGDGSTVTEIALRDIIKNIQRAASRLHRPGPFDVDILSLNFPALCLKLLPQPPTLFSTTPLHSPTSWPIDPPSDEHLELVKATIKRRLKSFMQVCPPTGILTATTREELEKLLAQAVEEEYKRYESHSDCMASQWRELSEEQRAQVWHLEVMRALAKQTSDHATLMMKFNRAEDTIDELRSDVEKLKATRGADVKAGRLNMAPAMSQALIKEMSELDADPDSWKFLVFMDRYRDVVPLLKGRARNGSPAAAYFPGEEMDMDPGSGG